MRANGAAIAGVQLVNGTEPFSSGRLPLQPPMVGALSPS